MEENNQFNVNHQVNSSDPNQEDYIGTYEGWETKVLSNEGSINKCIGIYDGPSTSTGVGVRPSPMETWIRWKRMVNYPKNVEFLNMFMQRDSDDSYSDSSSSDSEINAPILKLVNSNRKEANWSKCKNMETSMSKLLEKNTISNKHAKGNEEGSTNIKLDSNQINILHEKYRKMQMFCNDMEIEENPQKKDSGYAKQKSSKPKQIRKKPY